ncbi:MAG TPA: hypothetical protein DDX98_04210 [Bacteroidales bacterium]|jgi:hypothetical protein|nr:hypothetical protein [Bacteroidales bacterium]
MNKPLFKTRLSLIGLILSGLLLILIIYVMASNPFSFGKTLLLIALFLSFSIPQFVASPTLELHEDYLEIAFPLLSILPRFRKRHILYSDIDYIEYCNRIREPNWLIIYLKDKSKQKFWFRFRYFSKELEAIGKLLQDKNINVSNLRFGKTKLMK